MPKMFPHGDGGVGSGPARGAPSGSGELPERWFWDPRQWASDDGDVGGGHPRVEAHAAWAAVLGLAGLVALAVGQTRHFGGLTDAVVAAVALGGTMAALVSGGVGLSRVHASRGRLRGRGLASVGVAEGVLAVLGVTAAGLLAMAAR